MGDKISFKGQTNGKKFDEDGKVIREFNKASEGIVDEEDIKENKIGIDSMIMTYAISDSFYKSILIMNLGDDFPYTTEVCKKETIGNIQNELKINSNKANDEFKKFQDETSLKFLNFKDEYYSEACQLFQKVISSELKIRKKSTFLKDCINLVILIKENVKTFFTNDVDIKKVCKRFNLPIECIELPNSSNEVIRDYFEKDNKRFRYQKKGQRARR